ncbi:MAG: hypothetical protein C0606_13870 [Hyphomicrobiales bacterium]|nr:MAG: hypothetical protein C0606_13870 [Hyphomicrobiales bacterium]
MYLVIFDCDGTLVDSQNIIAAAMGRAFSAVGRETPHRSELLSIVGLSLPHAMSRLLGEAATPEAVEALIGEYKQAFFALRSEPDHHEPLYPGTLDALAELAGDDNALFGMATGKSRRGVESILKVHDFGISFATIQTADDAASKPHPEMIYRALSETGVEPSRAVMVGDTSFDMEMARAAGIEAIGVSWGYHPVAALHDAGACCVLDDFAELPAMVRRAVGLEGQK